MPIEVGIWRIDNGRVEPVPASSLALESRLEDVIERDVSVLGLDSLLVIGRQVITKYWSRLGFAETVMVGGWDGSRVAGWAARRS